MTPDEFVREYNKRTFDSREDAEEEAARVSIYEKGKPRFCVPVRTGGGYFRLMLTNTGVTLDELRGSGGTA